MNYESTVRTESEAFPGVWLTARRMSFGNRLDLIRRVKNLLGRLEFLAAGEQGPVEDAEAAVLASELDCEYLRWGLETVDGLEIDGEAATPASLIEKGSEALVAEAVELVRREAGLSEGERKNSESHSISDTATRPDGNATNAGA